MADQSELAQHTLMILGKVDGDAQTQSGKCKCGQRYNARSVAEIEALHENHLDQLGLNDPPPAQDLGPEVESVAPTAALHDALDPDHIPGEW